MTTPDHARFRIELAKGVVGWSVDERDGPRGAWKVHPEVHPSRAAAISWCDARVGRTPIRDTDFASVYLDRAAQQIV